MNKLFILWDFFDSLSVQLVQRLGHLLDRLFELVQFGVATVASSSNPRGHVDEASAGDSTFSREVASLYFN